MRRNRRFVVTVSAGTLILVVLAAGVLSAAAVGGRPPAIDGSVRAAGVEASRLAAEANARAMANTVPGLPAQPTSTSTPPTSGPTTTVSTTPGSTSTTVGPTPSTVANHPDRERYGRVEPDDVEVPFSPGQTTWSGVAGGVNISVTVDKAAPRAGEPIRFEVEASSAAHICCNVAILFGDGYMFPQQNPSHICPSGGPQGHGPIRLSATHTYNRAGRWLFNVQAMTGNCREPGKSNSLFGALEVGPGPSTGQGPEVPNVSIYQTGHVGPQLDRTWATVVAEVTDDDGWIRSMSLDWGDGSPPQPVGGGYMYCQETRSGWPVPTLKRIHTGEAVHHYAAAGTYTITLTAVSTGCDGSMTQTGKGTFLWEAPASG